MLINKNTHNYAAKTQEPAFKDGNIVTLKNDLLLWYSISKTFQHFDLRNDLIKIQYHNWRRHISHSYMNHQVHEVSLEKLLLSRPIRCELSRLCCYGHSLLLSSYLHRISRKENSASSASRHPLQDLNHLLLDCPASEPLRKSIFGSSLSILDLWSRPWGVARLLGLRGVPPRPHPSEGVG